VFNDINQRINPNDAIGFIDIGSNNITIVVARILPEDDGVDIVGIIRKSFSVLVSDKHPHEAIMFAIDEAEKSTNTKINKITMSINARYIQSVTIDIEKNFGHEMRVRVNHVYDIVKAAIVQHSQLMPDDSIIDMHYNRYTVDDSITVADPVGILATKIASSMHIVSAKCGIISRLNDYANSYRITVLQYIPSVYAAALACMHQLENQMPTLVINFGASEASFAIVRNSNIQHIGAVLAGGFYITQKIAQHFAISIDEAERIKLLSGDIYQCDGVVSVEVLDTKSHEMSITIKELNSVILLALTDILSSLHADIEHLPSHLKKNLSQILITGGVANTLGIEKLCRSIFAIHCKVGTPKMGFFSDEYGSKTSYSTAVGMTYYLLHQCKMNILKKSSNKFEDIFNKMIATLEQIFH
jgi:cell division protein FtsA